MFCIPHSYFSICLVLLVTIVYVSEANDENDDQQFDSFDEMAVPTPPQSTKSHVYTSSNINCESFSEYAINCTINAAALYKINKKSPPPPSKLDDWCRAVQYLTNCAVEWNTDCRDVTDSHFNDESINGHSYVVHNICNDTNFKDKYSLISTCVDNTSNEWEACYTDFKDKVDAFKKNSSADWSHYETHFHLCCARARFRRCVLDFAFNRSKVCSEQDAMQLQKFSVIVSEGDVYQDCDFNMVYKNCPGGDPRPRYNSLDLKDVEELSNSLQPHSEATSLQPMLVLICLVNVLTNLYLI